MNVLLNRFRGDRFQQTVSCSCCSQLATVVQLPIFLDTLPAMEMVRVCAECLSKGLDAISAAVLEDTADG